VTEGGRRGLLISRHTIGFLRSAPVYRLSVKVDIAVLACFLLVALAGTVAASDFSKEVLCVAEF
jgi:hypothetical protein